MHLLFLGN